MARTQIPNKVGPDGGPVYFDDGTGQFYDSAGNPVNPGDIVDADSGGGGDDFVPGGDNENFFGERVYDPNAIIANLEKAIYSGLLAWGADNGKSKLEMDQLLNGMWTYDKALGYVDALFQQAQKQSDAWWEQVQNNPGINPEWGSPLQQHGTDYYMTTGFNDLVSQVWGFIGQHSGLNLGSFTGSGGTSGGGGRGGGGGGRSPEDIRNNFDIEELTEAARNIWRGLLLTDDFDARSMAQSYVDAVVAGKGEKRIDFTTFIRERAKKTDRYASIYRSKPGTMSEEAYLAPYFQAALQVAGPDQADEIAIGGAQFGASSQQFAARLRRTDQNTSSAPFIEELHSRLNTLGQLFKG